MYYRINLKRTIDLLYSRFQEKYYIPDRILLLGICYNLKLDL
jgi:hypothetical protein